MLLRGEPKHDGARPRCPWLTHESRRSGAPTRCFWRDAPRGEDCSSGARARARVRAARPGAALQFTPSARCAVHTALLRLSAAVPGAGAAAVAQHTTPASVGWRANRQARPGRRALAVGGVVVSRSRKLGRRDGHWVRADWQGRTSERLQALSRAARRIQGASWTWAWTGSARAVNANATPTPSSESAARA